MRLRWGTRTPSKKIWAVSDERIPSLSSRGAIVTPGDFNGTTISDFDLCSGPSLVLASMHIQSAWVPFVIQSLPPSMT